MLTTKRLAYGIETIDDFLTLEECQHFIELTEGQGYEIAMINGPSGPSVAQGIRNNLRVILDDAELADRLWQRARSVIPEYVQGYPVIGFNERFRFYRYERGQYFAHHADGPHRRQNGEQSRLTFMAYLNEDFEGGETNFAAVQVTAKTGMGLCFLHNLIHEGAEVLKGRKYVLRTDVMCGAEPIDV